MVAETLNALSAQFAQCQTVAYADLTTNMVLITNDDAPHTRETLNALCAEAAVTLGAVDAPPMGSKTCTKAVAMTAGQTHVFLRTLAEPNDVLCCICENGLALDAFLDAASACLSSVLGESA